jgi:hypothetical protein
VQAFLYGKGLGVGRPSCWMGEVNVRRSCRSGALGLLVPPHDAPGAVPPPSSCLTLPLTNLDSSVPLGSPGRNLVRYLALRRPSRSFLDPDPLASPP